MHSSGCGTGVGFENKVPHPEIIVVGQQFRTPEQVKKSSESDYKLTKRIASNKELTTGNDA